MRYRCCRQQARLLRTLFLCVLAAYVCGEQSLPFWALGRRRDSASGLGTPRKVARTDGWLRRPASALSELQLHLDYSKPEQVQTEEQLRDKWIADTPHNPPSGMAEILAKAAWRTTPDSKGLVMLTSGNLHALDNILPRWLDSLSRTRDGDLTKHAVVVALGSRAVDLCLNRQFSHHCLLDGAWPGPDEQYHFPDDWYVATTLNKVDLMHSVLSLGYSLFWVDTDIVHFGNALPFLDSLEADLAIGCEYCHSWQNYTADGFPPEFEHNTGTLFLRAGPQSQAFVLDWLTIQRQHLLEWGPEQFDKEDIFQRRSDQVTLNKFILPRLAAAINEGKSNMRLASLSHYHFPNWCGGPCGCKGPHPRAARRFIRLNNEVGHLVTGRIECAAEQVAQWYMYHVPCAGSPVEKLSIIDAYQHLSDSLHVRPVATSHRRQD